MLVRQVALAVPLLLMVAACGGGRLAVDVATRPQLEARVAADSLDGEATLRLAAALAADGMCGAAIETARRGIALRPQDALGPLVAGECLEQSGAISEAMALYEAFLLKNGSGVGAPAVAARLLLAQRQIAITDARRLLETEATIATGASDPNILAVMPLEVVGDPSYTPLAYGIASLIESDLALVRRFTLVERTRLDALMQEIAVGQQSGVDPATAARAGRLLRAGGIVHGVTLIAPDRRIRFDVSVMDGTSRVVGVESVIGRVDDLFRLQKELVLGLVARLGYQLSDAERSAILRNGTDNLSAFLAYSNGLMSQAEGDYAAAAVSFARAVQADPRFSQARTQHSASAAVAIVRGAGANAAATLATATVGNAATVSTADPLSAAVTSGVQDVAPMVAETLTGGTTGQQATLTPSSTAPAPTSGILTRSFTFAFRVVFRFP